MAEAIIGNLHILCSVVLTCKRRDTCSLFRKPTERGVPDVRIEFDPESGHLKLICESFEEK